jgi:hypothetical protein
MAQRLAAAAIAGELNGQRLIRLDESVTGSRLLRDRRKIHRGAGGRLATGYRRHEGDFA